MLVDLLLGERSGWVTMRLGKGRRGRKVPIHLRARKALDAHLEQEQLADPAARVAHAAEPLFRSPTGKPLTCCALWYAVKKYARLAGVEEVTPRTFRHSVATCLVRDPLGRHGNSRNLPGVQPGVGGWFLSYLHDGIRPLFARKVGWPQRASPVRHVWFIVSSSRDDRLRVVVRCMCRCLRSTPDMARAERSALLLGKTSPRCSGGHHGEFRNQTTRRENRK